MKKNLIYKLGILPLMFLFSAGNAQNNSVNPNLNSSSSKEIAFDHNIKDGDDQGSFAGSMNTKALKDFRKNHKEADNAAWTETGETLRAEFIKDGIDTKVFYDHKGRWVANIRSYPESKMPENIRHQIKSTYYDYSILYVQEITVGEQTAYLVKIEDEDRVKTIRIVDGQMDVYHSFEKSIRSGKLNTQHFHKN